MNSGYTSAWPEEALKLQRNLASCSCFEELGSDLLGAVARALRAETGVIFEVFDDDRTLRLGRSAHHAIAPAVLQEYYRRDFIRLDPVYMHGIRSRAANGAPRQRIEIVHVREMVDDAQFDASYYYTEFLHPVRIYDVLALVLRPTNRDDQSFVFGFHRPRSSAPFSPMELAHAMQLAPSLQACCRNFVLTERLRRNEEIVDALLRATGDVGFAILDGAGDLVYANPRAAQYIGYPGSLPEARRSRVHAWCAELCEQARSLRAPTGAISAQLPALGGRTLQGSQVATAKRFQTIDGGERFVLTLRPSGVDGALTATAARCHLSPRETEIVVLISSGLTNKQIAGRLQLSTRTIENHLRSIFRKAGAHSRTQLLHRMQADPAEFANANDENTSWRAPQALLR
jgi:DNA-binding CsgD family transcriptional regulator